MSRWVKVDIPKSDKPIGRIWGRGKWIIKRKGYSHVLVACSECGQRYRIPNYCFKSERYSWKCCPICLAEMKGVDDEDN